MTALMTSWWRAPVIAAAIATAACAIIEVTHRQTMAGADRELASLQRELRSEPQLAQALDRERDIAGMLNLRHEATNFVHSKQASTWATLALILPPASMPRITIGASGKRFQISGPVSDQKATEAYLGAVKGITVLPGKVQAQQFVIQGERK
jgi:hypothetical protein